MTGIMDLGVIESVFDQHFKAVHARGMGKSLVVLGPSMLEGRAIFQSEEGAEDGVQ